MGKTINVSLDTSIINAKTQFSIIKEYFERCSITEYCLKDDQIIFMINDAEPAHTGLLNILHDILFGNFIVNEEENFIFNKSQKKQLPIFAHKEAITSYPYISMFLALLDIEHTDKGWWNSNFINLLYVRSKGFYTYIDDRACFADILNINGAKYMPFIHVTADIIQKALNHDYYVYVWIDSNIFRDWSPDDSNRHEAHPVLIYGYNLEKNVYQVYRFSPAKGLFTCEYPITEFHTAIEMSKPHIISHKDDHHIAFVKKKTCLEPIIFDCDKFVHDFYDYANGTCSMRAAAYREELQLPRKADVLYGIDITKEVAELFLNHTATDNFDYRLIHLIIEQKGLLFNRLKYINTTLLNNSDFERLINEFQLLYNQYTMQKVKYMKTSLMQTHGFSTYDPPKDILTAEKMSKTFLDLYEKEKSILSQMTKFIDVILFCADSNTITDVSMSFLRTEKKESSIVYTTSDNTPVLVDGIKIYMPETALLDKTLFNLNIFSQGKYLENLTITKKDHLCTISFEPHMTNQIMISEKEPGILDAISNNIVIKKADIIAFSSVSASSYFDVYEPENVKHQNNKFWCPLASDRQPFLKITFSEPKEITSICIEQDPSGIRIQSCCLFAIIDGQKHLLANIEHNAIERFIIINFSLIKTDNFIIEINKTKESITGQSIPLIRKIAAYR